MILLGRDLSPFVRRCATLLGVLELPFERKIVAAADDGELIRQFNPLGRIPALILDDDVVIDSAAIVDYALELGDENGSILAKSGVERRTTLSQSALATGIMEKGVAAAYELSQRPKEFVYLPYRERVLEQVSGGLGRLEELLGDQPWFGATAPNLTDINAVVAYDFIEIVAPNVLSELSLPHLANLSQRANELPAFAATKWAVS